MSLYTIGHSTRSSDEFMELLTAHKICQVADIRRFPSSARHPHFNRETLSNLLDVRGVAYKHFRDLGGRRAPRPDSPNTAWHEPAFRGYADYMGTSQFSDAVSELLQFAERGRTTVMCAEAVWWRCHRRLLADALVASGLTVWHILTVDDVKPHQMSDFAKEQNGRLVYPGLV